MTVRVGALRPGGWLPVERMDFFPIHTAAFAALYRPHVMVGLAGIMASSGETISGVARCPPSGISLF
jgi:hypothetical protein